MKRSVLFVVMVAVAAAFAAGFAPQAWAVEPPDPDICAVYRTERQLEKASILPERKDLWQFLSGLGVRRGATPFEATFQITGWSQQDNVQIEIENYPAFLLGIGPSQFFPVWGPRQVGVAGSSKFYEDSRSRFSLFEPEDIDRQRPYPIPAVNVGLARSAFYTSAYRFEMNVTRPIVCAAFEAVRQGRVDRPVVVLAVENVTFCVDFNRPQDPQICGLNIEGRVTGIFFRPEIPSPPPSTDGRG